jgi:hypothetical protein
MSSFKSPHFAAFIQPVENFAGTAADGFRDYTTFYRKGLRGRAFGSATVVVLTGPEPGFWRTLVLLRDIRSGFHLKGQVEVITRVHRIRRRRIRKFLGIPDPEPLLFVRIPVLPLTSKN